MDILASIFELVVVLIYCAVVIFIAIAFHEILFDRQYVKYQPYAVIFLFIFGLVVFLINLNIS